MNNMNEQNNQGMNNTNSYNGNGMFYNNSGQQNNQGMNNTNSYNGNGMFYNNSGQQMNQGMNNTNSYNGNGMFYNNSGQQMNQEMNSNQPNMNKNIPNKQRKKIILIVVIIAIVAILLAFNFGKSNSTKNYEHNTDSSPSNNSTTENDSSTPNNSTINKEETIKIRADKYLNIDFKYLTYDSTGYVENREILFKAEITNKSKERKYMTGTDINIYDSSDNEIGYCFPYPSAEKKEGSMAPIIEPEKTMTIYYYCYIISTSDLSRLDKVRFERSFKNSDFKDEKVQYYLNIN